MEGHAENEEEMLPGTRRIVAHEAASVSSEDNGLAKHGDVILVPQPTQSPNDPLNWGLARKVWHSALVCYITALTAATSNIAGTAAVGVYEEYGISYDVFNTGAGVLFVAIGYWTLLSSPLVHLYGRRISYLISSVWGLIGNIWFGRLRNQNDSIWSQLFVGASESVGEAVVQLSLLDIWFEHQNGTSLGLYTLATSVGTYVGPLIAGHIAHSELGWRWIGYMGAIFSALTFLTFYFGLEETAFDRDHYLAQAQGLQATREAQEAREAQEKKHVADNQERHVRGIVADDQMSESFTRKKSYWSRIALITPARNLQGVGFKQYMYRLWHTLRIFTFPAVWFAGMQWGAQNVALSYYLSAQEDIWIGPPWNYDDAAVANMNLACLVGSVIGCIYGGWCSDKFLIWMSRRNKGVMEAEFRLYLMVACVVLFPTGMWLFGIGTAQGWDWPVPYVGLGFIGFGYGCAGDLSITYLADSYPDMVLEGMVGVAVINNTLAMIFTFAASGWLDAGVQNCFIVLGVLGFLVLASSLPMIIWGKAARRWTNARYTNYLRIRDSMDQ